MFSCYIHTKCTFTAEASIAIVPVSPFRSASEEDLTNSPHGPITWGVHGLRMSTTGISDMGWGQVGEQVGGQGGRGERGRCDSRGSSGGESRLLLTLRAFPCFWKMPLLLIGPARINHELQLEVLKYCRLTAACYSASCSCSSLSCCLWSNVCKASCIGQERVILQNIRRLQISLIPQKCLFTLYFRDNQQAVWIKKLLLQPLLIDHVSIIKIDL